MKNNLYLDMHIIQTVPPSCVNRDDTGSPKTAIYGGTTRARVSSQAWKSAMRKMFRDELFVPEKLGSRTKLVLDMVEKEILNIKPDADARKLAKDVLTKVGFKFKKEKNNSDEKEKTNVLYFISNAQAKSLAEIAVKLSNKEITFMTTKKMLSQDTFKVMEENETIIMDAEMGRKIFLSLGLKLKESIKKYRESYELENALVEIDINDKSFCPFPYIEIETDSIENLEKVVTSLGYTLEDTTSQTIYDILAERGITGSTPGR